MARTMAIAAEFETPVTILSQSYSIYCIYENSEKLFYYFSTGQSVLINKASNSTETENASTISLGDFAGTLGYRHNYKKNMYLGVESKFYYSSKLNDKNIALLFMVGFKI